MKVGFIGCGNMANAMIRRMVDAHIVEPENLVVSNRTQHALDVLKETIDCPTTLNNLDVVKQADIVVLSVKPQVYQTVIDDIKNDVNPSQIIISIAPSFSLKQLEEMFGKTLKIVRTMPNTPAMVGQGMTAMVCNEQCTREDSERVYQILSSFGKCAIVTENQMPAVVAVSGSSPAYVYMFIEALADGAVRDGMPRNLAYEFAAQAVLGSAQMVLETKLHPGVLKDAVCSPAGTTIEAVSVLEQKGFRSSIIDAMKACTDKMR